MIDLYTAATPNGFKVSIMLEEVALPYTVHQFNLATNQQKEPWFLAINPNGRIPAIVDSEAIDGQGSLSVFESGAILIYLAEKTGKLLPKAKSKAYYEVMQWLMFQMSALGPMAGQAFFFQNYAPEKIPFAIERYINEVGRLLSVLESHLQGREYLSEEYSIADIAIYPWLVGIARISTELLDGKPNLKAYIERIGQRPAVQKGMKIPQPLS